MLARRFATTPNPYGAVSAKTLTTAPVTDQEVRVLVGRQVRALRRALGWSQDTLARRIGVHQGHISGIERGARAPSLERLFALARAFEVAPARLVKLPVTDAAAG